MRKHFIDNLRWLDILMLIPYHVAMAWNTWDEPNYIRFRSSRPAASLIVFLSPCFMPLLCLLAGTSTSYALKKRTPAQYICERASSPYSSLSYVNLNDPMEKGRVDISEYANSRFIACFWSL